MSRIAGQRKAVAQIKIKQSQVKHNKENSRSKYKGNISVYFRRKSKNAL